MEKANFKSVFQYDIGQSLLVVSHYVDRSLYCVFSVLYKLQYTNIHNNFMCHMTFCFRYNIFFFSDVGLNLRRDDPASLKTIIQEIQLKANMVDTLVFEDKSRVQFMLDILLAIKNNNMRKIPNYDPEHLEHLRKLVRNYIRSKYLPQIHKYCSEMFKTRQ